MAMPNADSGRATSSSTTASAPHLASLDAFRGFVIMTMIFVNYLHDIKDIPAWAKHWPYPQDGYTFVDVVFPGFLFMVGMGIPLSLRKRQERGDSLLLLLGRIVVRTAGLLFLGVIMVNGEEAFSAEATGMSKELWYLLAFLSAVVIWTIYPTNGRWRLLSVGLRLVAVLVFVYLLIIFRGVDEHKEVIWLRPFWWGILGLIGWAYLVCSIAYLLCRGDSTALMGILGLMVALYIGSKEGVLDLLRRQITDFLGVKPFADLLDLLADHLYAGALFGSHAAIVMAGVLVGNTFLGSAASQSPARRMRFFFFLGLGLFLAGSLLRPLHGGIIKNDATESYVLVTAGICTWLYLGFYFVIDVMHLHGPLGFLMTVGKNPLLAYLLPDIVGNLTAVLGNEKLLWPYESGGPGAINAAAVTALILVLTWVLTKLGVRLRL
jgi:predicted acyltransferase